MDMAQQTIVWTAFCLVALGLALWRPDAGRRALGVFFIIMAVGINVVFVLAAPDGFVDLGTSAPLLSPWGWVFEHVVARAPAVFGLLVASYEITIGLLMIKGGRVGKPRPARRHRLPAGDRPFGSVDGSEPHHGGCARRHPPAPIRGFRRASGSVSPGFQVPDGSTTV